MAEKVRGYQQLRITPIDLRLLKYGDWNATRIGRIIIMLTLFFFCLGISESSVLEMLLHLFT